MKISQIHILKQENTLLSATMKGVFFSLSKLIDSIVCGSNPCMMSTTKMAISQRLEPLERRLLNQTFFKRILVGEEGKIEDVELTPVYAALAAWEPNLGRPAPTKTCTAKTAQRTCKRASCTNPDPILRGQGLYKTSMVELVGLEPTTSTVPR